MDQKILTQFQELLKTALADVTKKDDLQLFATKDDLRPFATKDDLLKLEKRFENRFTTKQDLKAFEQRLEKKFATKKDLEKLHTNIIEDMSSVMQDFLTEIDNKKVDKNQFNHLNTRVTHIEQTINA